MHACKKRLMVILLPMMLMFPSFALADPFVSGSSGADGAFAPATNTVLQTPENGVFNFTTVTIPSGVTVTFSVKARNPPVTILATGDVTINGTINLNGAAASYSVPGSGGPGGFDGGQGGLVNQFGRNGGGPGGGNGGSSINQASGGNGGGGGGYLVAGGNGSTFIALAPGGVGGVAYGNEKICPEIGGSGGGGGGGTTSYVGGNGGGGGGSLLIASSGTIAIGGTINADGGDGAGIPGFYSGAGGGGSGGSIRLLANTLAGNGTVSAAGGTGARGSGTIYGGNGSVGRIRIEAATVLRTVPTIPPASFGYPYSVQPTNMPTLKITAVGGINVERVPRGTFGDPDVILPFNIKNPVTVTLSAVNIPVGQTVTVSALPASGAGTFAAGTLSGTDTASTASIPLILAAAYPSLITATVTYELAAMNIKDFYIAGEKVERVRVAANLGGKSSVTYITASGREIQAAL